MFLQSILSSQYYLLTFLPLSHPTTYLPMLFRLWESINSYAYDDRMLQFLSRIAEIHVDPSISDPKNVQDIPDDAKSEGEGRPNWSQDDIKENKYWPGLFKDGNGVGIFSDHEVRDLLHRLTNYGADGSLPVASNHVQMPCLHG